MRKLIVSLHIEINMTDVPDEEWKKVHDAPGIFANMVADEVNGNSGIFKAVLMSVKAVEDIS